MRLGVPLLSLILMAAVLGGCGDSSGGSTASTTEPPAGTSAAPPGASAQACALDAVGIVALRVTQVSCGRAQRVALAWRASDACAKTGSRSSCSVQSYRCVAVATARGWSVSCAKQGASIAFTARRG
jgi:hypothetical protein